MLGLAAWVGCGGPGAAPDAALPSTIPISPEGRFVVASELGIPIPPAAGPVLATLAAATDGPDDPTRYLVDRMIASLPDGATRTIATQVAPYVAAYLNARLADIAPGFVAGLDAIAGGLSRIASHLGTVETLQLDATGVGVRTITGVRFELGAAAITVRFADCGLADIAVGVHVALDTWGQLTIADHSHALPYGALLRLGLDRAIAPSVAPAATDLASALAALVDCDRLGALVADRVGVGVPALYRAACRAGMIAIAGDLDDQLAAIDGSPVGLEVTGVATGVDLDGDGTMDAVRTGTWSGALYATGAREPILAASFTAAETP